ncbi:MAG: hypothetical protein M0T80_10335, partial [Actinomycetota bacterium]|nr:hypothetical protein [Actinomycetota bacterium]
AWNDRWPALLGRCVVGLLVISGLAAGLTACGEGAGAQPPDPPGRSASPVPASPGGVPGTSRPRPASGSAPTSTTISSSSTTTTTVPASLPASPELAASALLDAWVAGDRASAAEVASPEAVQALFSTAYDGQSLVPRGCSRRSQPSVTCNYGPAGEVPPSSPTYRLVLVDRQRGWYVQSALVVPPPSTVSG